MGLLYPFRDPCNQAGQGDCVSRRTTVGLRGAAEDCMRGPGSEALAHWEAGPLARALRRSRVHARGERVQPDARFELQDWPPTLCEPAAQSRRRVARQPLRVCRQYHLGHGLPDRYPPSLPSRRDRADPRRPRSGRPRRAPKARRRGAPVRPLGVASSLAGFAAGWAADRLDRTSGFFQRGCSSQPCRRGAPLSPPGLGWS